MLSPKISDSLFSRADHPPTPSIGTAVLRLFAGLRKATLALKGRGSVRAAFCSLAVMLLGFLMAEAARADVGQVPAILSVSPTSGPIEGGTTVTIVGSNFKNINASEIGDGCDVSGVAIYDGTGNLMTSAAVSGLTDNSFQISMPPAYDQVHHQLWSSPGSAFTGGAVSFELYTNTGCATGGGETSNGFVFLNRFIYSLATPSFPAPSEQIGSTDGGETVKLIGSRMFAVTDVKFGNISVEDSIEHVSDTALTVKTPAHAAGSVDITVTDAQGRSATAPHIFMFVAPMTISPSAGALPAARQSTAYSQTISASGGSSPYSFGLSEDSILPEGLSLNSESGEISGTPTETGNFNFTVVVTDAGNTTKTVDYSLTVDPQTVLTMLPSAGPLPSAQVGVPYSQTITATDGAAPYRFTIGTGALPQGLSIDRDTGVISGTPTDLEDASFLVTVTDAEDNRQSSRYSISVNPAAPLSVSPPGGALTSGQNGVAYSQSIVASGGVGPYTIARNAGSLPPGLRIDQDTGLIYGTPSEDGVYAFEIAVGDSAEHVILVTYAIMIHPRPSFTLQPPSGSLPAGRTGESYSQSVTPTGGAAPYSFQVNNGSLPPGLNLDPATGLISGTPSATGNFSFTVAAMDADDATSSADYSIVITSESTLAFMPAGGALSEAMAGEDYSQQVTATGGSGSLVYSLESGTLPPGLVLNVSTGEMTGPLGAGSEGDYSFDIGVRDGDGATARASYTLKVKPRAVTAADKTINVAAGATPANVNLAAGATGGPFVSAEMTYVEPANAGTLSIVNGEFAQSSGPTSIGWYLKFTPNSSYQGEVRVGYRLTSALGISNTGTVTYMLAADAAKVAEDIDHLVHGFVQSRQNLIANSVHVPGLMERRQMANATDPVTARMMPSDQGMTIGFSTSLAQLEAARDNADGLGGGNAELSPFNIWIDGTFLAHSRGENDGKWGAFAMISAGADYLLTDKALVGLSVHYDRMTDPTEEDAELTGNGWLAGPYASLEIGKGVFWDASLLYGGSANDIDTAFWDGNFDTSRWLFDTSVSGRWSLDAVTTLQPKLRAVYLSEKVDDYAVENDGGDVIGLDGFTEEQLRVSIGAEIARVSTLENDMTLTRKFGGTVGYSAVDGSGMFGSVTAGLSLQMVDGWSIDGGLLFNIEGDGDKSVGAKVGVSGRM